MALVHVIDIATGEVVAAYPVPPVTNIPVEEGQEVQFVDIPYGNPAAPNVIVEVIGDQDVQVTTDDGTVLIEGLFALLEEGAQVRMVFSDTGQTYGDGQSALTVPEFASLDAFAPTAAGGTDGGAGGTPSGTGGRGNDGSINPADLNEPHIRAVGIDGLIPRPEFDIETDIETDNIQQPAEPIILTPTTAMVWEKGLDGSSRPQEFIYVADGNDSGDGEGGGDNNSILKIALDGSSATVAVSSEEIAAAIGTSDFSLGESGVQVDSAGNIFFTTDNGFFNSDEFVVVKLANGSLQVIASTSDVEAETGTNGFDPEDIVLAPDGTMYVLDDSNNGRIIEISDPLGTPSISVLTTAADIIADANGITAVDTDFGIAISPNGQTLYFPSGVGGTPQGVIAVDTATGTASIFNTNDPGFVDLDEFIATAPNGDLIVADYGADIIYRVDADTGNVTVFLSEAQMEAVSGGDVRLDGGFGFDSAGNFYLAEEASDSILVWPADNPSEGTIDPNAGSVLINSASIQGFAGLGTTPDFEGGLTIATTGGSPFVGDSNLVNGLGGPAGFGDLLPLGDDDFEQIDLSLAFPDGLTVGGVNYTSIFINSNGNVTFGSGDTDFSESIGEFNGSPPRLAVFWSDVDPDNPPVGTTPGGNSTGSARAYVHVDDATGVVTITFDDVDRWNAPDSPNAFQIQIIDLGGGNFDVIYRYEGLTWGDGDHIAGVSLGTGNPADTILISDGTIANLENNSNVGVNGVWGFTFQGGNPTEGLTGGGLTDDPGTMPDTNLEFDFGTLDTGGGVITNITHPDGTTTDNGDFFVVEGTFPGGEGIDWILTVNKNTGDFEFELLDNTLDHPGINLIGEDDQVFLTFSYSVDIGGQSASSTLTVGVKDDGPLISLKDGEYGQNMLFEDDLLNVQKETPFFPTATQGLNFNFGADGPNEDGMGFTIALTDVSDGDGEGGPLPSGLQTSADDLPVNTFYDAANKTLIGYTGEDPFNEDAWVFTVELTEFMGGPPGPGMANAVFTLYQAIEHPDIGEVGVNDPINLLFTVTATDGDFDTASVDVLFIVKDDGPGQFGIEISTAIVDEDGLVPDGDTNGFNDPNSDGDNDILTASGFIGIFGGFGADGPGANGGVAFAAQAAPAGLTSNGEPLVYSVSPDGLTLTASADGETIFTVTLDLGSNQYNVVLSGIIDHTGAFEAGTLSFDLLLVDGDGDPAVVSDGLTIQIVDAQPVAEKDFDSVQAGMIAFGDHPAMEADPATGNVLTGVDIPDGDENATDGNADAFGADGFASIAWTGEAGGEIVGLYGTLTVGADGSYSYDLFDTNPIVVGLQVGESVNDVFEYTITDGDGDESTTNLVITVLGNNDGPEITVDPAAIRVSEEGLPGGLIDDTGSDDETNSATDTSQVTAVDPDGDPLAYTLTAPLVDLNSDGQPIQWAGDGTDTLTGTINGGGTTIITISIDGTGQISVNLQGPVDHPNPNVEDEISFTVDVTVDDSPSLPEGVDPKSDTTTVMITIEDDQPDAQVDGEAPLDMLVLDESRPIDSDTGGPNATTGLMVTTAEFADNFVNPIQYGADGAGDDTYALSLSANGIGSGLYALDNTDAIGQGDEILLSQVGNVITGSANGEDYFSITVNPDTGQVTFTQLNGNNIWHPNTGDPDDVQTLTTADPADLQIIQTVTDNDGDSDTAALDLGAGVFKIEDDGPTAVNDTGVAEPGAPGTTNFVIVFDRSGSMADDPNVDGFSQRIDLARAAVASLLTAAASGGSINVLIVDFATDADNSGWLTGASSVDDAIAYLTSLVSGGNTNYEAATNEVQTAFAGAPVADESVLYFLSDGEPTVRTNDGEDDAPPSGTTGNPLGLTDDEVATWEAFVDANLTEAFAVGVGNGTDTAELAEVGHPNAPIEVTDESLLIETLLSTLNVVATGNVLTDGVDDDFGTDGPGGIVSFSHNGVTYFADGTTAGGPSAGLFALGIWTIDTAGGGEIVFNMLTGQYDYENNLTEGGGAENFGYTIADADGDQDTATLTITLPDTPEAEGLPLVVDDFPNNGDTLNGGPDAEILGGDDGNDSMNGGGGNDLLFGGDGVDTLNGGIGDDFLMPGQGDDVVFSSEGNDVINLGSDSNDGTINPNFDNSDDTVFYTDVLHAGDVIHNFDTALNDVGTADVLDLEVLFDNLGVADNEGARFARVQIIEDGTDPNKEEVWIDTNGDAAFDTLLVTVNISDGGDLVLGTDIEVV